MFDNNANTRPKELKANMVQTVSNYLSPANCHNFPLLLHTYYLSNKEVAELDYIHESSRCYIRI
jgi:hypothetical protein